MEAPLRSPWFLLVVVLFVLAEWLWRSRIADRGYDAGAAAASFGVALGGALIKPVTGAITAFVFLSIEQVAPWRLPTADWSTWVIGFIAVEFVYYWFHRWSHTVRWLWASHVVHHSASEFTFPAAIRLGWTGVLSGGWLLFAPLVFLGLPALVVAALIAANLVYQFFLHTEAVGKLGPLELVLNTPAHHRVHHASNAEYIDKNFGGVVIVLDRLFGTFASVEEGEPLRYGLVHEFRSRNPIVIALHEWARMLGDARRARSWRRLGAVLFGRP